jgi:hypothetical protein
MRAEDIKLTGHYAYIDPYFPSDPLRAVVIEEPAGGTVRVAIHHPDTGPVEEQVETKTLHGPWTAPPVGERWAAAAHGLRRAGRSVDWANVCEDRIDAVRRQRALADRLARVSGIRREHLHYAGRGGTSSNRHAALLQLNHDELEKLLSLIEGSSSPAVDLPGAPKE